MDNDIQYINNFYNTPHKLKPSDIPIIEKLLNKYKRDTVENKYILLVGNNDTINKIFILFLYYYAYTIKAKPKDKHHCAIDFEFNVKVIALMQLNFGKYLWIIDPKKYDSNKIEILNKKLLLNTKIYKVFHGADSLDLPYIYSELLKNDKEKILRFTRKFIDTRFLCEYVRASKTEEGRCSIYDAMLYFGTISKSKYDELNKINDSMGPIQDVMWNINKMSSFHIKYAYYDVLYLLDFLKDIYKKIIRETPNKVRTYYYIIQIIRFVLLERKAVTNILDLAKSVVNPMNNYLIKTENNNMTLINIYTQMMDKGPDQKHFIIKDDKGEIDLNFIESLNYIRGTFNFLLKNILYYVCTKKYEVYKNKSELFTDKLTLEKLYDELNKIKMYKIIKLLKLYENEVTIKLRL